MERYTCLGYILLFCTLVTYEPLTSMDTSDNNYRIRADAYNRKEAILLACILTQIAKNLLEEEPAPVTAPAPRIRTCTYVSQLVHSVTHWFIPPKNRIPTG